MGSIPCCAGNLLLLKVKQWSPMPGGNLHLNSVILLTGSQKKKTLQRGRLFLCAVVEERIKILTSTLET